MKQGQKSIIIRCIKNNSGQAVVEYVLLAIIVVTLIMGMGKVFRVLDDGFNQYIGGYISCLMEYGELPSLGVQAADLKKHTGNTGKKCDAQFAAFSFAEGRPLNGGGGSSSGGANQATGSGRGGANGRGGDGSSGKGTGGEVAEASAGDEAGDTASGLTRGRGGRGGRGGDKNNSSQGGYSKADAPFEAEESKTRVIEDMSEEDDSAKNNSRRRRNLSNNSGNEPYRAITGRMKQELEKQQKRRAIPRQPTRTVTLLTNDEPRFTPVKKPIARAVASESKEMNDSGANFSFGNIIRWLLIAAMVLAIIIFFGGQVMNYSNSKD